ncbi:hypothetical protein HV337_09175 [Citrobacter freundii]|uniref:hypothetical protein n=1 Tax=Citrobacter freundii TaxID=546 RepID=UPI0015EA942B|nr:hypothetical protein [Citrobacter freundii]QLR71014.1 hypothetical protein HV337_09175 [Citrobacter freundii]
MKPTYEQLEQQVLEQAVQLANAESKCRELAAENSGLKDTLSAVIDRSNEPDYQSIGMGCGVEDNGLQTDGYNACEYGWREAMDRIYSEVIPDAIPETPATDAFLAEVRAAAVDEVCLKISNEIVNCYQDEHVGLDAAATICGDFAAQLRQGGAV